MNNIIEQYHRFIKKRIASLGFRSAQGAWRTIEGYEAMHAIRKGQIRSLDKGDVVGQRQFMRSSVSLHSAVPAQDRRDVAHPRYLQQNPCVRG